MAGGKPKFAQITKG